uniref:B30.2/SPRY domain-containing protein n=1 Tax=Eutreptiella gymnastica TaxID=73025 RepID=A0A7S1NN34_9EUGL|mmetsp:Transcript_61640/g.109797  ORF Transcript_61640/g.109797 Transcript_61640/m.109797 type:complete len:399 (+) Transcript_61640:41-1237(+)
MGRTKDRHLRQDRDRGQGWDKKYFDGNPNDLTMPQLQEELAKRGLTTGGPLRSLRNRFIRALCVGITPGKTREEKPQFEDTTGKTIYFEMPDTDVAYACLEIEEKSRGRIFHYNDADRPRWTTINAVFPVPPDTRLAWSFVFEKMYNVVVGVAREDVNEDGVLGSDTTGWGYFINLASKHFNDPSGVGESYGKVGKAGDKVTVIMDTHVGSLEFMLNGKSLGEAFHGIYGSVYPSISVCGINTVHVGQEKVLESVALPATSSSLTGISLTEDCQVGAGQAKEGVQFRCNCPIEGGELTLRPMAFGVSFSPKSITVSPGDSVSMPMTVTASVQAKAGPIPVTVLLTKGEGLTTEVPKPSVAVDGLIILPAQTAEDPLPGTGTEDGTDPQQPAAKKPRVQ